MRGLEAGPGPGAVQFFHTCKLHAKYKQICCHRGAYTVEELTEKIYAGEIQDSKTVAAVLAYKDKWLAGRK